METTRAGLKGSEGKLTAGMIGGFVIALVTLIQLLPMLRIRLPGMILLVLGFLGVLGLAALAIGFMGVGSGTDNSMAKFSGIAMLVTSIVQLLMLTIPYVSPVAGLMVLRYGLYASFILMIASFGLGGLAISQTKELWGKWGKIASAGFYAVALFHAYRLATLFLAKLSGQSWVLYVGIAFMLAQVAGAGSAGLGFMEMKKES